MDNKIVHICPNCGLGKLVNEAIFCKCEECCNEDFSDYNRNGINLLYEDIKDKVILNGCTVESKKRLKAIAQGKKPRMLHYPHLL